MKTAAGLILTLVLLLSCDDPVRPPGVLTSCDDAPGLTHSGSQGNALWKAADAPHRLSGTVTFDALEIEAGTLVCGESEALLQGKKLTAIGTADAPIVFTAADPDGPWGGLRLVTGDGTSPEMSRLHHVVLRNMLEGIEATRLEMRDARIAKPCQAGSCAAIRGTGYSSVSLEDVVIDSSGGAGVASGWRSGVSLVRVRIQHSASVGVSMVAGPGDATNAASLHAQELRIVGGASYPAMVSGYNLARIAGSRAAVDSLLGNGKDTLVVVTTGGGPDSITVFRDLPWRVDRSVLWGDQLQTESVRLEAGASIVFTHRELGWGVRRLVSEGTEADPVRIVGGNLMWLASEADALQDTVQLTHAILEHVTMGRAWPDPVAYDPLTLELDHVTVGRSRLVIPEGTRARIRNSVFDSSRIVVNATDVRLENVDFRRTVDSIFPNAYSPQYPDPNAITVDAGSVTILGCEITASEGAAIQVREGAAQGNDVSGCNLFGNAGPGIDNLSPFVVQASGNWWGDPAGPDGPEGDSVSGDVVVDPVRTEPVPR